MKKELANLHVHYIKNVAPKLLKDFAYASPMAVPKLVKIVLNMGVGEALNDKNKLTRAVEDMTSISAQKPVITLVRKSIAGFKIRNDMPIGCKVTLRRARMYEFLERLISIAIPRIRDFRGLSNRSFDGQGNYTFGVTEQIIFPEIDYDKVDEIRGLDITLVTTAKTNNEAKALLSGFGFPIRE